MLDVLCVGHASFDITMTAAHHPGADEKMLADALQAGGGGPAANAAVQVARLDGDAGFCGYLGNDIFGCAHLDELIAEGVETSLVTRGAHPTPLSQILAKPDGTRSVVNFKADTPWLVGDVVDDSALQHLAPGAVLFDGHEPLLSATVCNWARARGIPTVLDAGSLHRGTRELAGEADYLVASEKFARQWSGSEDIDSALAALREVSSCVVVTCGEGGLYWSQGDASGSLAAFAVEAVDTTGAGDAFHGAFALGLARGMDWQALLRFASAAGALACTRLGARSALADSRTVNALLAGKLLT